MAVEHPVDIGWSGTIAGEDFHSDAWVTLNLSAFRNKRKRRTNTVLGGRSGARGNRSVNDVMIVQIYMLFVGDCDRLGSTGSTPSAQFEQNLKYWQDNVIDAEEDSNGCIPMELQDSDGNEWTADVQVDWIQPESLDEGIATLTVVVPAGRLTAV